jgi:hypothetical protein
MAMELEQAHGRLEQLQLQRQSVKTAQRELQELALVNAVPRSPKTPYEFFYAERRAEMLAGKGADAVQRAAAELPLKLGHAWEVLREEEKEKFFQLAFFDRDPSNFSWRCCPAIAFEVPPDHPPATGIPHLPLFPPARLLFRAEQAERTHVQAERTHVVAMNNALAAHQVEMRTAVAMHEEEMRTAVAMHNEAMSSVNKSHEQLMHNAQMAWLDSHSDIVQLEKQLSKEAEERSRTIVLEAENQRFKAAIPLVEAQYRIAAELQSLATDRKALDQDRELLAAERIAVEEKRKKMTAERHSIRELLASKQKVLAVESRSVQDHREEQVVAKLVAEMVADVVSEETGARAKAIVQDVGPDTDDEEYERNVWAPDTPGASPSGTPCASPPDTPPGSPGARRKQMEEEGRAKGGMDSKDGKEQDDKSGGIDGVLQREETQEGGVQEVDEAAAGEGEREVATVSVQKAKERTAKKPLSPHDELQAKLARRRRLNDQKQEILEDEQTRKEAEEKYAAEKAVEEEQARKEADEMGIMAEEEQQARKEADEKKDARMAADASPLRHLAAVETEMASAQRQLAMHWVSTDGADAESIETSASDDAELHAMVYRVTSIKMKLVALRHAASESAIILAGGNS